VCLPGVRTTAYGDRGTSLATVDVTTTTQGDIMIRTIRTYAAAAVLVAAGATAVGATPSAAATDQGCPSGWTTYQTAFLLEHGFSAMFLANVDLNLDGVICGTPLSPQQQKKFCSQFPDGCQQPVILGTRDNTNGKGY